MGYTSILYYTIIYLMIIFAIGAYIVNAPLFHYARHQWSLTSRKIPRTANPSGSPAATLGESYLLRFQWTRWSWNNKLTLPWYIVFYADNLISFLKTDSTFNDLSLLQLDTFSHLRCVLILDSRHLPNEHAIATIHILPQGHLHKDL